MLYDHYDLYTNCAIIYSVTMVMCETLPVVKLFQQQFTAESIQNNMLIVLFYTDCMGLSQTVHVSYHTYQVVGTELALIVDNLLFVS